METTVSQATYSYPEMSGLQAAARLQSDREQRIARLIAAGEKAAHELIHAARHYEREYDPMTGIVAQVYAVRQELRDAIWELQK